jgi:hypothetical protein
MDPLNRAIGAPVSDPACFKMRDLAPGRRPAFQFKGVRVPSGVLPLARGRARAAPFVDAFAKPPDKPVPAA